MASSFPSPSSRTKTMSSRSSSSSLFARSSSPTRLNLSGHSPAPLSSSVRFSIDRPTSPGRSISVTKQRDNAVSNQKRMCMCSPTTHPGSFRCAYHKRLGEGNQQNQIQKASCPSSSSGRLNLLRSAMKNSLVRIGGVEGEMVKRALTSLIRPSSHQQRRREGFQRKPSRLSVMSKA